MTNELRNELAQEICRHTSHVGWGGGSFFVECLNIDCHFSSHGEGGLDQAYADFSKHVADNLIPFIEQKLVEERERIAKAIEKRRNEHWQNHLKYHPFSDAISCPEDYGKHDAYHDAARIAGGE